MKKLIMAAAVVAGFASHAAQAGPLPEAKPDEVGFSQAGLARMDDFFAREIAAKSGDLGQGDLSPLHIGHRTSVIYRPPVPSSPGIS